MPPKKKHEKKHEKKQDDQFLEMQRKKKKSEADAESESIFKSTARNSTWDDILSDYEKEFKQKPEDDGALRFPSHESAVTFFTQQAVLKRDFLVSQVTEDRKPTGQHMFSCGDGNLYKGSFVEIKQQLETALAQNDSPELRKGLKTIESHLYRDKVTTLREDGKEAENPSVDSGVKPPVSGMA